MYTYIQCIMFIYNVYAKCICLYICTFTFYFGRRVGWLTHKT